MERGNLDKMFVPKMVFLYLRSQTFADLLLRFVLEQSNHDSATVMACISIANIVKTSLGPVGLDKMLVDDIGDTTVFSWLCIHVAVSRFLIFNGRLRMTEQRY